MTQVRYGRLGGGRYVLSARGHATPEGRGGTADRGDPDACCGRARDVELVSTKGCAYLSGILYSLAGYLINAAEEGFVRVEELRLESGDALVRFQGDSRGQAVFDMAVIGLKQLEKSCPEQVKVVETTTQKEAVGT